MPPNKAPQYDIYYERSGGTSQGFMLATRADGSVQKKVYQESRKAPLSPQMFTTAASYAAFPPEQDMPIAVQAEYYGGFGLPAYTGPVGEGTQHYESIGWDTRQKSKLILSSQEKAATVTNIAAASSTNYTNFDFETWAAGTALTGWTKDAGIETTQEAATVQAGTYSAKLSQLDVAGTIIVNNSFETWSGGASGDPDSWTLVQGNVDRASTVNDGTYSAGQPQNTGITRYYQDLTWDASYQGQAVTFTMYSLSSAGLVRLCSIDDGAGTTNSANYTATSTWEQMTVTKTLDAAATRLRLGFYGAATGAGETNYFDGPMTIVIGGRTIYQNIGSWASYYNNKAATLTCYANSNAASNVRIGVDDGASTTWSSYHTGGGAWENLSVAHTPAPAATRLRAVIQRASTATTLDYVDSATFAQTAAVRGTPVDVFQWGSTFYYIENKTLYSLSSTTFTEIYTFPQAITDYGIFGANLVITAGTAQNYLYSSNGTTWTLTTNANCKMQYLATVGGTLYGSSSLYQVKSTADPTSEASWSTAKAIGNAASNVTGMTEYAEGLFIGKEEGPYYIDSAATVQSLSTDFKGRADSGNFKQMVAQHGILLLPNSEGLARYEYTSYGDTSDISPIRYAPNSVDFHGRARAPTANMSWIFVAFDPTGSNTKSKLMAVRNEGGDYRWHCLQEVDLNPVIAMGINSSKLWVAGTKSSVAAVKYYSLAADDYPAATTGVKVEFEIDDSGSWTEIVAAGSGSYTTAGTKAFQANQSGKRIRFRMTAATQTFITSYYDGGFRGIDKNFLTFELYGSSLNAAGGTATPVITGFVCRGVLAPATLRVIDCVVKCADGLPLKSGIDSTLGNTIKTFLNNAVSDTNPGTFYDIRGNSFKAKIKAPSPEEMPVSFEDKDRVETELHVIFQEVKTS